MKSSFDEASTCSENMVMYSVISKFWTVMIVHPDHMHGPHSVLDIGHCTLIHCDAGGVLLVDQ